MTGNELLADGKNLVLITGANQGGKSTFLRSVGLAQLLMQCGLFVPATRFASTISHGIYTHFKREEDTTMNSGKLDEELGRMSEIADSICPNAFLLCNESFASTNEREGSEIAKQITLAFVERHVEVFFVTHLYEFAKEIYDAHGNDVIFLRAERNDDGIRTFKMVEGKPLQTSHGEDLYHKIFEE